MEFKDLDIETAWRRFEVYMAEGTKRFIPNKKHFEKKQGKLPLKIRKLVNVRNKLWRIYRLTGRTADWEEYRRHRNEVVIVVSENGRMKRKGRGLQISKVTRENSMDMCVANRKSNPESIF